MTDPCRFDNPRTVRIRALNDAFRTSLTGGRVMITRAVAALGADIQREIFAALRRYDDFDAGNDPYGEHDFGRITVQGHEILFKIDYYDQDLVTHSPDPSGCDPPRPDSHAGRGLLMAPCRSAAMPRRSR